ncbi:MAG TPA: hypothetical protein VJ714_12085 [Anaerolineae bacterium]|jgi:hypothetical protein|nr:hypothetical protein [Anaerolineae bacterium]
MAQRVIVHLADEDPIVAEIERIPDPGDSYIRVIDPRREDGKPVQYLKEGSAAVIFPMHRISSIEILTEGMAKEEEITFFREELG